MPLDPPGTTVDVAERAAGTPRPEVPPEATPDETVLAPAGDLGVTVAIAGPATPAGPATLPPGATTALAVTPTGLLTPRPERRRRPLQPGGAEGPLAVGQQFGRYLIIRLLGLGGMGAVYQAWDAELEVAVAVKVIRPEVMADRVLAQELERRFKRELLLARQVTHRNVVRIHDLGELEGIKYITMSYVIGAELGTMLAQEGRLPVPRALHVIRGVVSGLVAAHEAGVVHRDLKPANIMVEEKTGDPLIMDFGIARSEGGGLGSRAARVAAGVPAATASSLAGATMVGSVVGTTAYMAPEQAKAQEVDHRADLYSVGLIFYDLLLGERRLSGDVTPVLELQQRLEQPPPSPRSLDPDIPEAVDQIIMRCLAPDPADRYQTAPELAADLARLDDEGHPLPVLRRLTARHIATAAAAALSLMGTTYWYMRPVPLPPLTSVLVADFVDRTNTPVFRGTLENALASGMEGASFITAYPRSSAQQLAGEIKPGGHLDAEMARLISAREGIRVVLAGTVDRSRRGYSVKVDAVDPAANTVLASAEATAASRDRVLAAVASTAASLRRGLGDTAAESAQVAASETVTASSLEALQAYSRAQELADANRNREALSAYRETVKLDPRFGRAWAGMGVVHAILKDEAQAKTAYEEALKHVDRMTEREKLRTLGTYYMMVARNYEKAIENYETLVRLYPADDGGHANLGLAYLYVGNVPRALAEARQVLQIYPSQHSQRYNYAMYAMYAGELDTAVAEGTRVMKEAPSFELAFVPVALALVLKGERQKALATYDQLERSGPSGASLARFGRADLAMYRGRYRDALGILEQAAAADGQAGSTPMLAQDSVAAAESHLALGQTARAVSAARRASTLTTHESVLFPAARVLLQAGRPQEAEKIASILDGMLQTHTTAYAQLIRAELAVQRGRGAEAIELFRDSIKRRDTWFARYLLGRVYAEAAHFPEALAELDACAKRYGEAADVFFYDTPSLRYLPPLFYWLGRSQEALRAASAPKTYERFLALRADADPPDPLAADARLRLADLSK